MTFWNIFFFLFFLRKLDLTFHANCLLGRQFAWNVKSNFLGKIREISCLLSAEFDHSMASFSRWHDNPILQIMSFITHRLFSCIPSCYVCHECRKFNPVYPRINDADASSHFDWLIGWFFHLIIIRVVSSSHNDNVYHLIRLILIMILVHAFSITWWWLVK